MSALGAIEIRRRASIMDKATFLNKGIRIPDPNQIMWIQTKHNYKKHVERMENWKKINEEEEWASKAGLVILFMMNWETLMPDIKSIFFNTFVIKGTKYLVWVSIQGVCH